MLKNKISLFKLLGFTVSIDASWSIILFLIVWSLAKGFFPGNFPDLSEQTYWLMAIVGALGLFASIIIHEFSHALIARKYGLKIQNITLFIFGGVAEMKEEPGSPKIEFFMAIAGPIASLLLSILFGTLHRFAITIGLPVPVTGVLEYLGTINMLLAAFNMIPAFPTDGGRVLRSILWWAKNDIRRATRMASRVSLIFSVSIIFIGFINIVADNFIGGLWWILIGSFLFSAANISYHSLVLKQSFEGKMIHHFMNPAPITVPSDITLQEFVDHYLYRYPHKMFPVTKDNKISGIITIKDIKAIPSEEWQHFSVGKIMQPKNQDNSITANTSINDALAKMNKTGLSRLLVTEHGRAIGIITLKDLLEFIALKMELEE
ncbi:MAG: hypothetical protein QG564_728 [Campylobacterota bacterium]|nr:hypothetical protein [Campylobacterota bacterium]